MKQVLVIQTAFLGDVILATPVATELKRCFPEVEIDFLVKKGNESLLSNHPALRNVMTLDKSKGKFKAIRNLIKHIRGNHYDLVINLHRFGSSGIIAGRSGAPKRYGFKKNPFSFLYTKSFPHQIGDGTHEVTRNLSIIKEFGANDTVRPSLYPSKEDQKRIEEYAAEEYFCMAPASVWYTKQLPQEKWIELIQTIKDKRIYLLGSKADLDLCNSIIAASEAKNAVNLAGELSLLQSAALMKNAMMNFVNDSGPLHLASAMNANTTAFFCSTVPDFGFGPLAENSRIQEVNGLACRPCGLHGHKECPKGHFDCGRKMPIPESLG